MLIVRIMVCEVEVISLSLLGWDNFLCTEDTPARAWFIADSQCTICLLSLKVVPRFLEHITQQQKRF